ncbi:MAG: hypothetical protein J1F18_01350 [Lachnospiraceae bacterium]|nr:hypothetical protein [Lachnospiraceae bacterium]
MAEQEYFKSALSDFTHEAASGGAIRHLADLGYTARQITEKLTYPTPYERVQKTVWKHLIDTGVVLTQEPGSGRRRGMATYTVTHGKYGRASFRLEQSPVGDSEPIRWKERRYSEDKYGSLAAYLTDKCSECGEDQAYISCDFGLLSKRDKEKFDAVMQVLNERQKEYISGLLWEEQICYHRLDGRMREIVVKLYAHGYYRGYCYFLNLGEKIEII